MSPESTGRNFEEIGCRKFDTRQECLLEKLSTPCNPEQAVFNHSLVAKRWETSISPRSTCRCKKFDRRGDRGRYRRDTSYRLVPLASKDYVSLADIYVAGRVTVPWRYRNYVAGMQHRIRALARNFRCRELLWARKPNDLFKLRLISIGAERSFPMATIEFVLRDGITKLYYNPQFQTVTASTIKKKF